ncbi:hypothetical protein LX69_03278 [Breznakibacter xylanolyticus]|uniref:Uncharacterized protein n=1 Tax=Breznakibacter xylanolyticus TaxID=990 RepID=A0A2W7NHZ4_9BACT|nr:hypothetical protein [Breznakibacter xylanolyticus]PZX10892.1 hypothetical protein LX69_03278 [Breznakibacter xylanolyticus]
MDIQKIYDKIYELEEDNHLKAGLYFSIIQIKKDNPLLSNEVNTLYLDAKKFISCYINSIEERDLGYDVIDTNKILKCINLLGDYQEQFQLAQNAYRLLRTKGFEDESKTLRTIMNQKKTQLIKSKPYFLGKYFKLILHLSSYSLSSIALSIFTIFIITYIVLLPAPIESWQNFSVVYHSYSDSFYINHMVNIITSLFGVTNDFKVETSNLTGIFTIMSIKLFYLVFIVNYLYKKFIDIING